jgi:hypothetical protein
MSERGPPGQLQLDLDQPDEDQQTWAEWFDALPKTPQPNGDPDEARPEDERTIHLDRPLG